MNVTLTFAWGIRAKLRAEGAKLRAEGDKLRAEGDKLWAEGAKLWAEAVIAVYGNVKIEWNYNGTDYDCTVEGETFKGGAL